MKLLLKSKTDFYTMEIQYNKNMNLEEAIKDIELQDLYYNNLSKYHYTILDDNNNILYTI